MLDLTYIDVNLYTTFKNFYSHNEYFESIGFKDVSEIPANIVRDESCWEVRDKTANGEEYIFNLKVRAASIPMFDNSDLVIMDDSVPDWIYNHYNSYLEWKNEKHFFIYKKYEDIDLSCFEYVKELVLQIHQRNVEECY